MEPNQERTLEEQVSELRARVQRLEAALQGYRVAAPQNELQSDALADTHVAPPPLPPPPMPALKPGPLSGRASKPNDRSLESRIGSQWFNRIGILAVLIGMSWFLKLAIDNHWIGPLGRVLIGLVAGAGLVTWSERFQRSGYAAFAYSLKAVGSGILYLSLWAAFSLFHLIPAAVAFAAMILVTAFNGFLAWVQDSELLALYSIVGGFSTPVLLSTGENHEVTLFAYLLVMNVAVLLLLILKPWSRLLFGAFVGTVLLFSGWWIAYYANPVMMPTAFFLACFFLIFAAAPRLVNVKIAEHVVPSRWDRLATVVMPMLNAAFTFLAAYIMTQSAKADWAAPWIAVAFAAFYLLLLRLPARGVLRESPGVVSKLHLTLAVAFLSIAIPLKAHGRWLTIGWLVQGAALLWVARRAHSLLLRVLALLTLALGLVSLVVIHPATSTTPFFNQRFATYLVAIAIFAFSGWLARRAGTRRAGKGESTEPISPERLPWSTIAAASVLIVNALVLLAVGWEIHNYWWSVRWSGGWNLLHDYRMYAQFTYSAFFMTFGAMLLSVGFWRRSSFLRWQALLLVAVSIGKVFLVDVSELSQGYRILSFLGLGGLLLGVSFVYQRDWLHLRAVASAGDDHDDLEPPPRHS